MRESRPILARLPILAHFLASFSLLVTLALRGAAPKARRPGVARLQPRSADDERRDDGSSAPHAIASAAGPTHSLRDPVAND